MLELVLGALVSIVIGGGGGVYGFIKWVRPWARTISVQLTPNNGASFVDKLDEHIVAEGRHHRAILARFESFETANRASHQVLHGRVDQLGSDVIAAISRSKD